MLLRFSDDELSALVYFHPPAKISLQQQDSWRRAAGPARWAWNLIGCHSPERTNSFLQDFARAELLVSLLGYFLS
jgi:hypothetical protein